MLRNIIFIAGPDDIEMVYRDCSLKSLDSQCGDFEYEKVRYQGCIMSCTHNGCNSAGHLYTSLISVALPLMVTILLSKVRWKDFTKVDVWFPVWNCLTFFSADCFPYSIIPTCTGKGANYCVDCQWVIPLYSNYPF